MQKQALMAVDSIAEVDAKIYGPFAIDSYAYEPYKLMSLRLPQIDAWSQQDLGAKPFGHFQTNRELSCGVSLRLNSCLLYSFLKLPSYKQLALVKPRCC